MQNVLNDSNTRVLSTGTLLKIINLIFPSSFTQIAEGCNTNFEVFEQRPAPRMGLVVTGFIPSPLEKITEYYPTAPEVLITLGVWAMGFFILTILYKVAISVKEEIEA